MEELDRQHQEAIDELLHLKNEVVKENSELKEKVKCFLEKTDHSSQDCFLNKNLPSVQTDHIFFESNSSDIASIEKHLNLLSLFHDLRCSSNKDRLNDILKWLGCQKQTLEVQQSIESKDFINKINKYILFLEMLSMSDETLTLIISELSSVIDFILFHKNDCQKLHIGSEIPKFCAEKSVSENQVSYKDSSTQNEINILFTDSSVQCDTCSINSSKNNFSIQTDYSICNYSDQRTQTYITDILISKESKHSQTQECETCDQDTNQLISKLRSDINVLEQEKMKLENEILYYKSLCQKKLLSVLTQTDEDCISHDKILELELEAARNLCKEKEEMCNSLQKEHSVNLSALAKQLQEKESLIAEKEEMCKSLQKEYAFNLNSIKENLQEKESLIAEKESIIENLQAEVKSLQKYGSTLTADLNFLKGNYVKNIDVVDQKIIQYCTKCRNLINTECNENLSCSSNETRLLQDKLKMLELEKNKLLCVLNEKSQECSSLKSEVHKLTNIVASEKQALLKLQQDNCELKECNKEKSDPELTKETVQKLSRLIRDKDFEIESLKQKNSTLTSFIQDASAIPEHLQSLLEEKENLSKQINVYKAERERIMLSYNAKDKECRQYAAEIKKLNSFLSDERQKYDVLQQKHFSVAQQYEEKQKSLINTQNEMIALKQRVTDLEEQQVGIKEKYSELVNKINSDNIVQLTKDELDEKNKQIEQLTCSNDEKVVLIQEKDCMIHSLSQQIKMVRLESEQQDNLLKNLQKKVSELTDKLKEYEAVIEKLKSEKELIEQRFQDKNSELSLLKEMNERLNMALKEKEFSMQSMTEKISSLSQYINSDNSVSKSTDINQILADSESMFSKAQNLYRERDETLLALNQSRQENQSLRNEIQRMKSNEIHLKNELERLRLHLIEIEENYTHEVLKAEEREKELKDELVEVRRRAEISSTAVVDTNQRASIQIASLQEQLSMIMNQRDQALAQVSSLEDQVQQHSTSVSKLQLVLEQMQRSNERKMKDVEKKWQLQLDKQKELCTQLEEKLQMKQMQLDESSRALEAASRLSEQLDAKEEMIAHLKNELSKTESKIKSTTQEIDTIKSTTEGKVDRMVMKSLVLGYFSTPPGQKSEVIRLLARVLDFNQEEMEKAGIVVHRNAGRHEQKGLLSSIFSRLPTLSSPEPSRRMPEVFYWNMCQWSVQDSEF
ncbi:thyroid receptor-interacting protein 11-like isoform X2 [Stegodyphus dumicola]|uniref:thyroid receptor-interacting protein 11-like isoform X2 n=1 Tax=Stegodyphus dumicola TaxID=202533 RepID=UPI0015AC61CC|nr:thyroid receptor-interacting protein 11-like isoform X2 [Stegodyphus dumicola]